jgi:hypothetical protein
MNVYEIDAAFIFHQPIRWSVDVKLVKNDGVITESQDTALQIIHYAVSGDDNYVATLAINGTLFQLDVWKLEEDSQSGGNEDYTEIPEPLLPKSWGWYQAPFPDDKTGT